MSLLGFYPFTVYVANVFDPYQCNVLIKVTHHHHLGYFNREKGNKQFAIDPIQTKEYTIEGGYRLGFPMLMEDESLEIELDNPDEAYGKITKVTVTVGAKAKCYPTYNETTIPPLSSSSLGEDQDPHGTYYRGGRWEMDQSKASWKMIIRKYGPDPEDENVTVGEESPG